MRNFYTKKSTIIANLHFSLTKAKKKGRRAPSYYKSSSLPFLRARSAAYTTQ